MPRGRTRRATTRRTKADKEKDEAESATTTPAGSANNSDDDDEQQQQQQQPENSKKTTAATTKAAPATRRSRRARKPTSKVVGSPGGRKNAAASANSNKRGAPKKKDDEDDSNEEDDDDAGSEGEDDNKDQVDDDEEEEEETERSGKDDLEEDDTSSKKKEANDDESDDEEDGSSKKGGAEDEGDDDDDSADDDKPIASLAKGGRRAAAVAAKSKKGTRATKAAAAKPGTGRRATRRSSRTLSEGDDESDHKTAAKNKKTPITRRRKRGISAKSSEDESQASSSKGKRARTTRKTRGQSKNESDNDSDDDVDDDVDDENGVSSDNDEKGGDAMSVEAGDDAVGAKGSGKANDNDSADDQESDDDGEEDEKAATTGRRTRGRQQKKGKPAAAAATDKQTGNSKQQGGNQAAGKTKEQQKEAEKPVTRKKRTRGAAKKQQDSSSDEGESSPEEDGDSNNEKADDSNKATNKTGKGNGKDSDSRADESEDVDEDNKNSESESEHSKTSGRKASSDRKHLNNRSQIQSSPDADEAMSTTEEATKDATGKSQQKAAVSVEDESKDPIGKAEPEEKNHQNDPPEKEEVIEIDEEDDDDKTDKSSKAEKDSIKVGEQDVIDDNKSANTASDKVKDDAEVTVVSGSNKKVKQDPPEEKGDSGDASEIPEPMETADVSDKQNAKPDPAGLIEGKTGVDVEEVEMEEAPKEEHMLPTGLGNGEVADKTDQGGKAKPSPGNAGSSKTERQTSTTDAPTTSANFGKGEVKEGDSSDVVEEPEERPLSKEEVKDKTEIARGEDAPEKSSAAPPKTQQLVKTHKKDSTREKQGCSADVRKANEKEKSESTKDEPTTPENQAKVTKESLSVGKASAAARAEAMTDDNISLKEKVSTEALGEDEVETTPVNGASGNVSAKASQGIQSNGVLPSDAPKDSAAPDDHAEAAFTEQNAGESGVHDGDTEAIIQSEAREEPDALELAPNQTDPTPKSPLADDAASDTANEKAALEPPVKQSLPEDKPELMPVQAESVGYKPNVVVTSDNEVAGGKTIVVEEKAPGNAATSSKGMSFEPSTPPTTPPQPPVVMQVGDSAKKDTIDQSIVLAASDSPEKLAEEDEGSAMEVDAIDDTQVKRSLESNIEDVCPDNAEASPPVKRARVLSDAEASPSLSEFKSHDTSVPEEPEEPPEPPEPIEEVHVKRCDLDKIKAMLFSAGSLVHRGRGFEKMFSEYWGAISLIVVGDQDAKIIAKLRKVVKSFLKTKRLRKLHNTLILALIDRSLQETVPLSEVANVIPPEMRNKIAVISPYEKTPPEVKRKRPPAPLRIPQKAAPDTAKKVTSIDPISYAPLFAERCKQDTKPSTEVNKPFASSCLPGALVVDPIVRRIVESEGMQVSESAVWLVAIALKEYTKSIVGRTIQSKEARQILQLPPKPHFPRVLCKSKGKTGLSKKGSKGSKESPSKPLSSPSTIGVDPKVDSKPTGQIMIFPADISLLSANMKRNPMDSLGGTVSRLAVERCIFAPENTSQALRSSAFDDVHSFLTSEIMAASAERQKLLRSQRLAAKRYVSPKPASGDGQQDVKKEDFSAPRTSPPALERGASRSLSAGAGRGGKNLGLGRGAKNLAALMARATVPPPKLAADTAIESGANKPGEAVPNTSAAMPSSVLAQPAVVVVEKKSDNPKPGAIATNEQAAVAVPPGEVETEAASSPEKKGNPNQVVNRGRGLGKKNLLALRSRIVKPGEKEDAKEATSSVSTEGASPATASENTYPGNQVPAAGDAASTHAPSTPVDSTAATDKAAAETTTQTAQPQVASTAESGSQTRTDSQTSETQDKPTPDNISQTPTGTSPGEPDDTTVAPTGDQTKAYDAKEVDPVKESGTGSNKPTDDTVAAVDPETKTAHDISPNKADASGDTVEQPKQEESESTATKADERKQAAENISEEAVKPKAHTAEDETPKDTEDKKPEDSAETSEGANAEKPKTEGGDSKPKESEAKDTAEGETPKDAEDKKPKEETSAETSEGANSEKLKTEGGDSKPNESEAKDTEPGQGDSKDTGEKETKDNATTELSGDSSKAAEEK